MQGAAHLGGAGGDLVGAARVVGEQRGARLGVVVQGAPARTRVGASSVPHAGTRAQPAAGKATSTQLQAASVAEQERATEQGRLGAPRNLGRQRLLHQILQPPLRQHDLRRDDGLWGRQGGGRRSRQASIN